MSLYRFDDSRIRWQTLGNFEHLWYFILDVDSDGHIADLLFKFAAGQKIVLHRHKALNTLFVIQGEHRLYYPDGSLKEVRPTGKYTRSLPSDEPHSEGGGDECDVIILFSIRGDGLLYEILDDAQTVIATITFNDLQALYEQQNQLL
ncbi:hypothetical protein [Methylocucumis oryzae]|uniref:Regulator n=1 Tax=Methylocucumis oryzae TaxID=1632867 RepID=A0A0F3ILQ1_9GAMM|nr:hypothetical protein [Methylocucumis oryzae]KJV07680.1 regulator [Methylocucumis oryzae]